jgi:hypothetical protein
MDERPFPHGPLPQPPPSRRGMLLVGGLAALAAGGGVWAALSAGGSGGNTPPSPVLTRELAAAADAERVLIARIDAAAKHAHARQRGALRTVRAAHVAHLDAIQATLADALYPTPAATTPGPAAPPPGRVPLAAVRTGELQAARASAARAARLTGHPAVLLASISAAEATHAELLA